MARCVRNRNKMRVFNGGIRRAAIRYRRWMSEGRKDGMCGVTTNLGCVPKLYREAYNAGHAYGALSREAAYYA